MLDTSSGYWGWFGAFGIAVLGWGIVLSSLGNKLLLLLGVGRRLVEMG